MSWVRVLRDADVKAVGSGEAIHVAPENVTVTQDGEAHGVVAVTGAFAKRVPLSAFTGHCAGCDAAHNSAAFSTDKRRGYNLPAAGKRMIEFPFESAENNRICRSCYNRNRSRLYAMRQGKKPKQLKSVGGKGEDSGAVSTNLVPVGFGDPRVITPQVTPAKDEGSGAGTTNVVPVGFGEPRVITPLVAPAAQSSASASKDPLPSQADVFFFMGEEPVDENEEVLQVIEED